MKKLKKWLYKHPPAGKIPAETGRVALALYPENGNWSPTRESQVC